MDRLVPDQEIKEGHTLTIGRNRRCKIKDLKCSRSFCELTISNKRLKIKFLKDARIVTMKSGDLFQGPGFGYKIKMIDTIANDEDGIGKIIIDASYDNFHLIFFSSHSDGFVWKEADDNKALIGSLSGGGKSSPKIAAFDFDFTLIGTKTGQPFPNDENDWKLMNPNLPKFLRQLIEQDYRLVIFSNQKGISLKKVDVEEVKKRFAAALRSINLPCLVLIAPNDDFNRKPATGLWDHFVTQIQPETKIDYKQSFYVGDAAGRKKSGVKAADFSASDLLFASNCGLNFLVPEKFFDHMHRNTLFSYKFDSKEMPIPEKFYKFDSKSMETNFLLKNRLTSEKIRHPKNLNSILPSPHCLIFCGLPATGKTKFYENYLESLNYGHVSMDELRNISKCFKKADELVRQRKNFVIDNTNVTKSSRLEWIKFCKENDYTPVLLHFDLPIQHLLHNNRFRQITKLHKPVPNVAIYSMRNKFEEIGPDECSKQFQVNFVVEFGDDKQKFQQFYFMYLNEK